MARDTLKEKKDFAEVVGLLSLRLQKTFSLLRLRNSDRRVGEKLRSKGLPSISYEDRADLIVRSTAEISWMDFNPTREHIAVEWLQQRWPHLKFIRHGPLRKLCAARYALNGADDVVKHEWLRE